MKRRLCVPVLLAGVLAAGCAHPVYQGRLARADGWHEGKVTEVGEGERFARRVEARCEGRVPQSSRAPRYVSMVFERVTRPRIWTVQIPQSLTVHVGQTAYANFMTCEFEPARGDSPRR